MSSLAREVVFGHTASFKDVEDFTQAMHQAAPGAPGAPSRAPSPAITGQIAGQRVRPSDSGLPTERSHLISHEFVPSDEERPELDAPATSAAFSKKVRWGIRASWVVNWLLLFAKIAAFVISLSYSVLASAVDSLVDLLSQVRNQATLLGILTCMWCIVVVRGSFSFMAPGPQSYHMHVLCVLSPTASGAVSARVSCRRCWRLRRTRPPQQTHDTLWAAHAWQK